MTAALVTERRPPVQARQRPSYGDLLDLLAEQDEALARAEAAVLLLALYRRDQRPVDLVAERAVLGAMLYGYATAADVAGLDAHAFDGPGHSVIFSALAATLETAPAISRGRRWALAHRVLGMWPGDAREAAWRLDLLPCREGSVADEIATVRALGAWRRRER
jgi:hypothetical protein